MLCDYTKSRRLILLHGWMMGMACWDVLIPYFQGCQIDMLRLPGHGEDGKLGYESTGFSDPYNLASAIADSVPDGSIWIGWSLGGLIAQMVAALYPEKAHHLICVCSSPRFIAGDGWEHGMPRDQFDRFARKFRDDHRAGEREFVALQAKGDADEKALRKRLSERIAHPYDHDALKAGLDLLKNTDMREAMKKCQCPVSFIAGENDRLASAKSLEAASRLVPNGRYECVKTAAHAPMLSSPAQLAQTLERCLSD